jgi:hypothetical protein
VNRPEEEFSHQNSLSSQLDWLGAEQQLSLSFHEWPFWQLGARLNGGGGAVGTQQDCSVRKGKVSPGRVWSAKEGTLRPIPVRRRAAFSRTIRGIKDQRGTVSRPSTYGGLGGLLGGLFETQQLFFSYQNSLDLQLELLAVTDGRIEARRASGTRTREMRVMIKRKWAKERIGPPPSPSSYL